MQTGLFFKKQDGTGIRIYLRLGALTVDSPEICLLLCIYQASASANRPCPCCTQLRVAFLEPLATGECSAPRRLTSDMMELVRSGDATLAKDQSFTLNM